MKNPSCAGTNSSFKSLGHLNPISENVRELAIGLFPLKIAFSILVDPRNIYSCNQNIRA
jgi:hypothetical protein